LVLNDDRESPTPYLAEALPTANTDTWRILPDGRMETIYRLRPSLTWHDGAPLTAADFVFAWRVYATPELGQGASPLSI
jgi:ABC-type transport system substrate-binding protein